MAKTGEQSFDTADLLPTKDTLTALKSDVTLESAILELCDNALDSWKRIDKRSSSANIEIFTEEKDDRTELIIRDDAGGIPREEAAMLFGLGRTAKGEVEGSIGAYGVGAKKSLVNLGLPFEIRSHDANEETGWGYRITEEWIEDDDWTVPVYSAEEIDPGVTEIRIGDLNYEWDAKTAENLRERLGEAYNIFLSGQMQELTGTNYDLTVSVDGAPAKPEGLPDWSYSQFDGFHPRRYENIAVSPENHSEITLHITVGLLREKDSQAAGTDIYCQKRKVASCLRGEAGGYGTGQNQLGNFSARHERLKVIVELETDGSGQDLPWDTQKSSIDRHNPIMRGTNGTKGVYNWLRRTVQGYYDLDADQIPRAFLEPFAATHEHAANDGVPERIDYSDRTRVIAIHRPDTNLPEVTDILQKAEAHALLAIDATMCLSGWQRPAYRAQLAREADQKIERLTAVDECPPSGVEANAHDVVGQINEIALRHLEAGILYADGLETWEKPRYREYLDRQGDIDLTECEQPPSNVPVSLTDLLEQPSGGHKQRSQGPTVYSQQTVDEDDVANESAELFVVLGGDSDDERGAKVLELTREELCKKLDLDPDEGDDVLWEKVRHTMSSLLDN